jgi:hypothetical protein
MERIKNKMVADMIRGVVWFYGQSRARNGISPERGKEEK